MQRGIYGEILPEIIKTLTAKILDRTMGANAYRNMGSRERQLCYAKAVFEAHQCNLFKAMGGEIKGNPELVAIYSAVLHGEPLRLYPIEGQGKSFLSFEPVLQRRGDNLWQLGIPQQGRYALVNGIADVALREVEQLYLAWIEAELKEDG